MNTIPRFGLRIAAGASLILFGVAVRTAEAKDPDPLTLTPDHFKRTAAVSADPAAGLTTISTEPGFAEHTGLMRMVWHDEYLQGVIDDKTGHKSYQIMAFVIYSGSPRSYESAAFSTPNGPRSVKTTELQKKVELCATGTCTYTERIGFPIEEETLRQAAENAAVHPRLWRFELAATSGPNYAGTLSTAEIAGLLARVDETSNAVPAVTASAKTTTQRDLGIEGISVAASEEQPSRGGVLIAGVKSGSVAQKAGIVVGDIVYELDGHPIRTPADLQSAVAASGANSRIPLRLYRGLTTMTVSAQF
jgi:PDZ domain